MRVLSRLPAWGLSETLTPFFGALRRVGPATTFTFTAVNQNGGTCMDVPYGSSGEGVQLVPQSCDGGAGQTFPPAPSGEQ
ncbi:hypothetical protein [Nonomuraea sp. NPDC049695]|uniref:hypothetical protein n=1 Tax=Nonomuraea sp. NPDC049695 TaxID=3154734 RepID=UPI003433CF92